ncbi:hypothetical protein [Orbus mooreae]|uniref:hypothetical protein n=1 Tax=Orbus mooreae TaxID=3074107 RepID=UPI00370D92D3
MKKITLMSTSLLTLSLLLTACGESAQEKAAREQAEKEAIALESMPPNCTNAATMNALKKMVIKYIDLGMGKNKQFTSMAEISRDLNAQEYRCRARVSYNYFGTAKSHYLEYTIYWADNSHKQFQVEMPVITNL